MNREYDYYKNELERDYYIKKEQIKRDYDNLNREPFISDTTAFVISIIGLAAMCLILF